MPTIGTHISELLLGPACKELLLFLLNVEEWEMTVVKN